jgi:hypothetical protein
LHRLAACATASYAGLWLLVSFLISLNHDDSALPFGITVSRNSFSL